MIVNVDFELFPDQLPGIPTIGITMATPGSQRRPFSRKWMLFSIRLNRTLEKARLKNPRLFIHLGMYGYVDGKFADATLDTFADRLQALATSLHSTDSPVAFVDHRIGWVKATDLDTDLFHPSPAGMEKIAANWLRSLRAHHY